jgi:carboxyl-terminal processing protease
LLGGAVLGVFSFAAVLFLPLVPDDGLPPQQELVSLEKQVELFGNILQDLEESYVDEINPTKLFETAVNGMLRSLDPYTEFENTQSARNMQESVSGRYGGVGMVISSSKPKGAGVSVGSKKLSLPPAVGKSTDGAGDAFEGKFSGVTVMDAFEGFAYDGGMRVGDRLLSVAGVDARALGVEQVRDLLRGDPDTDVRIRFERDDSDGPKEREVVLRRRLVRMSDVRLATYLGSRSDGLGYINLAGFNSGSGRDFGTALLLLRMNAPQDLKGLVLDLRGNPGGLLDAAVEVASYLLPGNSEIVSSRGKDGMEIVYKSVIEPIRSKDMRLIVLVNGGSASASEIVAGAVQDTDSGVILGSTKTFGKGLVQKIVPLPFDSALKYTVAKYYTPSGRCIQAIQYKGGRADLLAKTDSTTPSGDLAFSEEDLSGGSDSAVVPDAERKVFYTARGRAVRDGGGIEPDLLVTDLKAGAAESVFLTKGTYFDFISDYVKAHDVLTGVREVAQREKERRGENARVSGAASTQNLMLDPAPTIKVDERLFDDFKKYVSTRISAGSLSLDDLFSQPLKDLELSLTNAGLGDMVGTVESIKMRIKESVLRDVDAHRREILNDLELSLLSRELPNRLLLQKNILQDVQVQAAVDLLLDKSKYVALLTGDDDLPSYGADSADRAFKLVKR